jgi:hypothetical protein
MDVMAITHSARETSIIVPRMSTSRGGGYWAMLEDPALVRSLRDGIAAFLHSAVADATQKW